jgi:hypothetical protein
MPAGRPTKYTPALVAKAWEYANGGWVECGDPVPSVAGLACEIGVRRETCHAWAEDKTKDFSNILGVIAENQERQLVKNGLLGEFSSPITKMMMTKHGYSDRIEQDNTSSDGSMSLVGLFDSIAAKGKTINDKSE